MAIRVDPENNETGILFDLANLSGQHVLEIGCGDGRLTWRYASRTAQVTAIDPFEESIAWARANVPDELRGRVEFHHIAFEDFASVRPPSTFDTAILAWSLC